MIKVSTFINIFRQDEVHIIAVSISKNANTAGRTESLGIQCSSIEIIALFVFENTNAKPARALRECLTAVFIVSCLINKNANTENTTPDGERLRGVLIITFFIDQDRNTKMTRCD